MAADSTSIDAVLPPSASIRSTLDPTLAEASSVILYGWVAAVEPGVQRLLLRRGEHHVEVLCPHLPPGSTPPRPESAVRVRGHWITEPAEAGECATFACEALDVLGPSENLPFVPGTRLAASASTRARYRYLEFRDPTVQRTLRQRHAFVRAVSSYLDGQGFVSVETPMLA